MTTKTTTKVRGVVVKNHVVFPFQDDHLLLVKARVPFTCLQVEYLPVTKELLAKEGIQLSLRKWEDISAKIVGDLAERVGAKTQKNKFLVADTDEDKVRDKLFRLQKELTRFRMETKYSIEVRSMSKTGKLKKTKSDSDTRVYIGLLNFNFNPEAEPIGSSLDPVDSTVLHLGSRRLTISHMQKLKSVKEDILHIRLASADSQGTEIEVLSSFDSQITPELKTAIKAFAHDLLNRFT